MYSPCTRMPRRSCTLFVLDASVGATRAHGLVWCLTRSRYKLKVTSKLPEKWYKDEGGRDKCMDVNVVLVDHLGRPVSTRKVPLAVVLEYEEGLKVTKQSILKVAPDSQLRIDSKVRSSATPVELSRAGITLCRVVVWCGVVWCWCWVKQGTARIRARIEDVSKNHQGQQFRMRIMPDVKQEPLTHDISADVTSAVTVRSKRNKRNRNAKRARDTAGAVAGPARCAYSACHILAHAYRWC